MPAYYNENDPKAAEWLRQLIAGGHIAPGDVDTRSIEDVYPEDLRPYEQCHFFAGLGGWSLALRLIGFPDHARIWTGSCPCQPFSEAGKGAGFDDERHLWPAWFHLIEVHRPSLIAGEQVASAGGLAWDDLVQADLEGTGYARVSTDICSAGVGAADIRQRLYWLAHDDDARSQRRSGAERGQYDTYGQTTARGAIEWLAFSESERQRRIGPGNSQQPEADKLLSAGSSPNFSVGLEHAASNGRQQRRPQSSERGAIVGRGEVWANPLHGQWRNSDWLFGRDGRWRPVEAGTFPLAHGVSNRVGLLRGYGNAINPAVAAEFLQETLGALSEV